MDIIQSILKITELRIGNHVALAYNPSIISEVIYLDKEGNIQLLCNNYIDEIRDIIGIPMTKKNLKLLKIPICFTKNNILFTIEQVEPNKINLISIYGIIELKFLHQLENYFLMFSRIEILTSDGTFKGQCEK